MIYAGIGSRETPPDVQKLIFDIADKLAKKGYVLRSGGADGADLTFEAGCDNSNGLKEIFLPWRSFNNNASHLYIESEEAIELAKKFHPAYQKLSYGAKKMMHRNSNQVMGKDMNTPCDFIICWTKDGKATGGTGQAIRIATSMGIPVYNLKTHDIPDLYKILEIDYDINTYVGKGLF